jgi:hypothetical protein
MPNIVREAIFIFYASNEMRRHKSSRLGMQGLEPSIAQTSSAATSAIRRWWLQVLQYATIGDYFLLVLALLLAGYVIFGKVFAYLGVPPVYIGEITYMFGVYVLLRSRCAIASFAALPHVLLTMLIFWFVVRTLPDIPRYGVDAIRDSMIVLYGGFSFILTAVLLSRPRRLLFTTDYLRLLGNLIVPIAPFLVLMSNASYFSPVGEFAISYVKIGTTGVHLAAAALLVLLGFRRAGPVWIGLLIIGMLTVASQNRGGMLAILAMMSMGLVFTGKLRVFGAFLVLTLAIGSVAYLLNLSVPTSRGRDISTTQVVENVASLFVPLSDKLDNTKQWRSEWWKTVAGYTLNGPYFWTGKGFGKNLAVDDGIIPETPNSLVPMLRSPHSAPMTILARSGVPGFCLWVLTIGSWIVMLIVDMRRARWRGDHAWSAFFLLCLCYGVGFLIDGTFDLTLEGPMAGIWFWTVFGVAVGASLIYRAEIERVEHRARPSRS